MKSRKKRLYWWGCVLGVVTLSILTFTPVVSPSGEAGPSVAGMPRALWAGILITVFLVILTAIGARVYPTSDKEQEEVR